MTAARRVAGLEDVELDAVDGGSAAAAAHGRRRLAVDAQRRSGAPSGARSRAGRGRASLPASRSSALPRCGANGRRRRRVGEAVPVAEVVAPPRLVHRIAEPRRAGRRSRCPTRPPGPGSARSSGGASPNVPTSRSRTRRSVRPRAVLRRPRSAGAAAGCPRRRRSRLEPRCGSPSSLVTRAIGVVSSTSMRRSRSAMPRRSSRASAHVRDRGRVEQDHRELLRDDGDGHVHEPSQPGAGRAPANSADPLRPANWAAASACSRAACSLRSPRAAMDTSAISSTSSSVNPASSRNRRASPIGRFVGVATACRRS